MFRLPALKKIGPHNETILSIIFGSMLGDAYADRDSRGHGTSIRFYQESTHKDYILWLHSLVSSLGYCSSKTPEAQTRPGRAIFRFNTFSFSSFN